MKIKKTFKSALFTLSVILFGLTTGHAVTNVLIGIQGTNVVISWPAKVGASYLLQYRAAFDTNNLWTTLTNEYPSAVGTNRTTYTIQGVVTPPSAGGGGAAAGGPPPGFSSAMIGGGGEDGLFAELVTSAQITSVFPVAEETILLLGSRRIFPPYIWDIQRREPKIWELEARPPMPWDARPVKQKGPLGLAQASALMSNESGGLSESLTGTNVTGMGFYRVFQLPKWPGGISNAVVEGLTFAAVDFDDYFSQIVNFQLFVDGQPTELGVLQTRALSGVTNQGVDFWFNEMANGPRQLRLTAELRMDDEIGISTHTPTVTLTSTLTSLLVSNLILYTNFDNAIVGNTSVYEAFSTQSNVDWTIAIYDVVDDFVISHSGYSPGGKISWAWDLYDWSGMLRDDLDYDPFFYSQITISPHGAAAAAPATKPTPIKVLDYPQTGYWLIVFQDMEKRPTPRQQFIDAMNNLSGEPASHGVLNVPGTLMLEYGTNVTQTTRNNSWLNFRSALTGTAVRNLYYFGHGSPSSIGGDYDGPGGGRITPNSKAYLDATWVRDNVTFNKFTGARYFRFVFLDGCETASGSWPQAFGMNKATNNLAFYQNANRKPHTRPSCFVGWNKVIGGSGAGSGDNWGTTSGNANWLGSWMFNWSNNAQTTELDSAFEEGRRLSGWITKSKMDSNLRLYGYTKLKFLQYNNRNQWPGP